jgi:tetratricopeptide (TPR) repeat protein
MFNGIRFVGVAALALLISFGASAQLSKGFKGKVLDRDGKPVVGVTVFFQDKSNNVNHYETKTDEKGTYVYGGLPYSQDGFFISVKIGDLPEIKKFEKVKMLDQVEVNFDMRKDIQEVKKEEVKVSVATQAKDLYGMEDYEGALAKSNEAILQNDSPKAASFLKAACLLKLNRLDEAREAFEAYNVKFPGDTNVLGQLAELYEKKGDKAKADEYKKQFKAKGGQIQGDTYNQGVQAFNSGDFAKGIEAFQAAIKEDPKDADAHRELAKCYSSTGKYSKAVEELKIYLKMKPNAEDKATYETAIKGLSALKDN